MAEEGQAAGGEEKATRVLEHRAPIGDVFPAAGRRNLPSVGPSVSAVRQSAPVPLARNFGINEEFVVFVSGT